MPLALDAITFEVETKRLLDAKQAIQDLSTAMQGLNKAQQDEAKAAISAAKVKEAEAKATIAAAKAKEAEAKAEESLQRASNNKIKTSSETVSSLSSEEKLLQRVADKTRLLTDGTIELAGGTFKFTSSLTSGQAALAANLKIIGGGVDSFAKLSTVFDELNSFANTNPFDKSVDGLNRIKREIHDLTSVNKYMAEGLGLSKDQIQGLNRDIERLTLSYKNNGGSQESLTKDIQRLKDETSLAAKELNALKTSANEADRIARQKVDSEKEAWNNTKLLWEAKRTHEERMYQESMRDMKLYYSELEKESNEVAKVLGEVENAINKEVIKSKYMQDGASSRVAGIASGFKLKGVSDEVIKSYINEATALEKSAIAIKERNTAFRNLANAEEKAASMVATYTGAVQTGDSVTERAAASIANYERWLRQAGISGDQATAKLKAFSAQQAIIAQQEQKQREAYLTRAIIPQFSDIFVGLTTGQNPLTIALQQLPQIQDLFTLTGVKAQDTVKVMGQAASEMLVRLQATALAVTQAIGLGFTNLGNSIVKGFTEPLKLAYVAVESLFVKRNLDASLGPQISNLELAARNASVAFAGLSKILGGTLLAVLGVVAIEMYKAAKANDALLISVSTAGAALGKSADELARLATVSTAYSTNASELKAFFAELAKEGFKASESLATVAEAAQHYSHVTGVSLSDLAKEYAKLNKDPVQALIDLGKATGQIDLATLQMIQSMLDAGDVAGATSRAIAEYAAAQNRTAKEIEENLSPLGKLYLDLKKDASEAWASVSEFANSDKVVRGIKAILEGFKSFGQQLAEINLQFVALRKLRDYLSSPDQGPVGSSALAGLAGVASSVKDSVKTSSSEISGIFETVRKEQERSATESEKYVKRVQGYMSMLSKLDMANPEHVVLREQINQLIARESKELEENLNKKKKKTEAEKEAEKVTKAYAAVLERFSDLQVQINRANADGEKSIWETTKAYGLLQDVMNDPSWAKFNESRKIQILQAYANAAAIEVENLLLKEQAKALKDLQKVQSDFEKNDISRVAEIEKVSKEIEFQYSILGKTDDEVKKLTREYKLQAKEAEVIAKYAKLRFEQEAAYNKAISSVTSSDERLKAEEEYLGRVNTLSLEQEQELANAKKQMNLEVTQDYVKQFLEIRDTIAEATYDALTGKGQDAAKKLRAFIEAQLKKQFIMPAINVMINAGMNMAISGLASLAGGSQAGGAGVIGGLNQAGNLVSNATSLYNNAAGGGILGSFSTGLVSGASEVALGSAFVGPSVSLAEGALGAGGAIGATSGSAAGAMSAIGTALPYIGWAVAIASLLGAFDDSDIPQSGGNMAWYLGGSSFSSTQVRDRELSGGMDKEIKNVYSELSQGLADMLKAVGSEAADVTSYFYTMINNEGHKGKLAARLFAGNPYEQTKAEQQMLYEYTSSLDSDASDFQEKLAEAYKGMAQAAIKASSLANNTKDLAVYLLETGTSVQELTANWDSIVQWMNSLSNINKMAPEVAANLTKLGGGLSSFQSLTNSYYSMFFSAAEQTNISVKQLEANFSDIGLVAPTTNEGFRSIVESLDLTTEAGQETFVKLLSLSSAFNQVTSAIDSFYATQKEIIDSYSTDEMLVANNLNAVKEAFASLGVAVPKTEIEFRKLAESADPLTESGRNLIQVLSGIKGSFDMLRAYAVSSVEKSYSELEKSIQAEKDKISAEATAKINDINDSVSKREAELNSLLADRQAAIKADYQYQIDLITNTAKGQVEALQATLTANEKLLDESRNLADLLETVFTQIKDAVDTLRGIVSPETVMRNAREYISGALQQARIGVMPDQEQLSKAIEIVTSDSTNQYTTLVDFKRAQGVQAAILEELGSIVGVRLSTEEQTIAELSAANTALQAQIDAINNSSQAQISVLQESSSVATENLKAGVDAQIKAMKSEASALIEQIQSDAEKQIEALDNVLLLAQQQIKSLNDILLSNQNQQGSLINIGQGVWSVQDAVSRLNLGISSVLNVLNTGSASSNTSSNTVTGIDKRYANGGYYQGGLALVGETGPEIINFNSPGQVYTAGQTSNMLSNNNSALIAEIKALREEVVMLRAEARATVNNTSKTAKLLDRNQDEFDSLKVTIVADMTA